MMGDKQYGYNSIGGGSYGESMFNTGVLYQDPLYENGFGNIGSGIGLGGNSGKKGSGKGGRKDNVSFDTASLKSQDETSRWLLLF